MPFLIIKKGFLLERYRAVLISEYLEEGFYGKVQKYKLKSVSTIARKRH